MAEERSFKRKVIDGFLWLGTGSFVGQMISWLSTIFVIRLLVPADYGLMAMASTFVVLMATVGELGIGASVIQAEHITEREVRIIFGVVLATSLCGIGICYLSAPLIASFYGDPRLVPIVRIMGITFLVIGCYAIPESLILREMDFRKKAQVDIFAQVGGSLLTLLLAVGGLGVWALVIGFMAVHAIKAVGFNVVRKGWVAPLLGYRSVKNYIHYGITVTGDRLLYNLYVQSDRIIVGKFLGDRLLGVFAVAANLASIPAEKILPIVTQVMFTSYSRIQNDADRIRRNILRTARAIAYAGFPLFFGMAAVAPEGIPLILGPKWHGLVVPFQLFCLIMPLKSLSPVLPPAIFAVGKPRINLVNMFISLVTMSVAFVVGVQFGLYGVCLAWVAVFPFVFLVTSIRCLRVLELPTSRYLSELRFPFLASLTMVGLIFFLRAAVRSSSSLVSFVVLTVFGALFYLALMYVFKKDDILRMKEQFLAAK